MTVWITSDTHFGHTNIIRYCSRPFKDADEMNRALVSNWNSVVQPNDTIWHLGDVTFGNVKVLKELNGTINLCLGNHDRENFLRKTGRFAFMTNEIFILDLLNYPALVLFHYPMEDWPAKYPGAIHFHGHSHGRAPKVKNRLDVGVDCFCFKPITLEEAVAAAH